MLELTVYIVAWKRPEFLRQTLSSLFSVLEGVKAAVRVVDNESRPPTAAIVKNEPRIESYWLLNENRGINVALETAFPDDLTTESETVLISDADMLYQQPLKHGVDLLRWCDQIGAVSYQHSPEHQITGELETQMADGICWKLKQVERGCSLMLRSANLEACRPLPVEKMADFDWWIVRDSEHSLAARNLPLAVLPGGAFHLGWRAGDSTWQSHEIKEFEEYRV